jgi:hypothetical protein
LRYLIERIETHSAVKSNVVLVDSGC